MGWFFENLNIEVKNQFLFGRTLLDLLSLSLYKKSPEDMFEFDQYLGFLAFLVILTMGFWLMIFLVAIVPYWIGGSVTEMLKEMRAKKKKEKELKA